MRKKNGWWGRPLIPEILDRWNEIADFEPRLEARSTSAVRPSEKKVQLTLIGSPICAFQQA